MIKLPAPMVGNVDHVDAVLDAHLGILSRGNTLEDNWNIEFVLDPFHVVPAESHLMVFVIARKAAAGGHVALCQVAFSLGVVIQIHREGEGDEAVIQCSFHVVINEVGITAYIELKNLWVVRRGGGHVL